MIMRFFRRLAEAWGFWMMVVDIDSETGRPLRIDVLTAWALATIRHPSPAQEAENLRQVREAIDWARAMHERMRAEEATDA